MRLARAALAAALLQALALAGPASAADRTERKFILVVADGLLWPHLADGAGRALGTLTHEGALGLMNVRTVWPISPESGYLTIGAGSRAAAPPTPLALQAGEEFDGMDAASAFESRTGRIPPHGSAVYLAIAAAVRLNDPRQRHYACQPGLLGGALARAGLTAACVGNADLAQARRRDIVAIAMDRDGIVPLAIVDARVQAAAAGFAPGVETDFAALLRAFDRVAADAQFIAVETGDTGRLHAVEEQLSADLVAQERRRRMQRLDRFLDALLHRAQGKPWRIMIVAPTPPADPERTRDAMTPIILAGPEVAPGLLVSASTRSAGIVTNTDIAPTVLRFFGIQVPPEALGRPMAVAPRQPGRALAVVLSLDRRLACDDYNRSAARDTLKTILVVIMSLACLGLLLDGRTPRAFAALLRALSLFVISTPLALLALGVHPPRTLLGTLIGMFALAIVIALAASALRRGWVWVAAATAVVITADLLFDFGLVWGSVLGYSPTVGARYYGLGNEYGGIMLAAVPIGVLGLICGPALPRRWQRLAAGLALLAGAVVVTHSAGGANLGIGLSCAIGFGIAIALLAPGGMSARRAAAIAALAAGVLVAIVAADLLRGGASSHIGRAAAAVGAGGWDALAEMVVRRTARNWLLAQRSAWSGPALLGLAVLTIALVAAPGRVRAALAERRALVGALDGAAAGAVAAFVLNDSGIVSAALALSYAGAVLTYLSFSDTLEPARPR